MRICFYYVVKNDFAEALDFVQAVTTSIGGCTTHESYGYWMDRDDQMTNSKALVTDNVLVIETYYTSKEHEPRIRGLINTFMQRMRDNGERTAMYSINSNAYYLSL